MATVGDFAQLVRERIAEHDLEGVQDLIEQLRASNPQAADELAAACAAAYWEAKRQDDAIDRAWSGLGCGAWLRAPRVIGGPSHTHVCRRAPEHEGDHACHSGDAFTWARA